MRAAAASLKTKSWFPCLLEGDLCGRSFAGYVANGNLSNNFLIGGGTVKNDEAVLGCSGPSLALGGIMVEEESEVKCPKRRKGPTKPSTFGDVSPPSRMTQRSPHRIALSELSDFDFFLKLVWFFGSATSVPGVDISRRFVVTDDCDKPWVPFFHPFALNLPPFNPAPSRNYFRSCRN